MTETAANVFRDFNQVGVPGSGEYEPEKRLLRRWGAGLESVIAGGALSGAVWKETVALLNADLAHAAETMGIVYGDATAANNGFYTKVGASGSGSWTKVLGYLPGYQVTHLSDTGAGTANAIEADSDTPLPGAYEGLLVLSVFEPNTGAATLAANGTPARPLVGATGGALPSGALQAGMAALLVDDGTSYRMLNSTAADVAASIAARNAAIAAAEASGDVIFFDTYADAETALPGLADQQVLRVLVDETRGDSTTWYRVETGALVAKLVGPRDYDAVSDMKASAFPAPDGTRLFVKGTGAYQSVNLAGGAQDPVSNPLGYWDLDTMPAPATLAVRGEQVPQGGFTAKQFGIETDGATSQSDRLNYALEVCSGVAAYNAPGSEYLPNQAAPLLLGAGVIAFDSTIIHQPMVRMIGAGSHATVLNRLGAQVGNALESVNWAALEADPTSQPLPPGMGLLGLTIIDGTYDDAVVDAAHGVALHGYGRTTNDLLVFTPRKGGTGFRMTGDRTASGRVVGGTGLTETTLPFPENRSEDWHDLTLVLRSGGDGYYFGTNDAHLGRLWAAISGGVGVRIAGNSLHADYIHAYSQREWGIDVAGPEFECTILECRDGFEGGALFRANDVRVGTLRANNNFRQLEMAHTPSAESTHADVVVANRRIKVEQIDVTVSRGGVGVLFSNALSGGVIGNNTINGSIVAPGSGTYAGQGTAVKFSTPGWPNDVKIDIDNFNHADAVGVHLAAASGQTNLNLDISSIIDGSGLAGTILKLESGMFHGSLTMRANGSNGQTLISGFSGRIGKDTAVNIMDRAASPQLSKFIGNSANIDITTTGIKSAVIALNGSWIGGVTPAPNQGQAQAWLAPTGAYSDFEIGPIYLTIDATSITAEFNVIDASAAPGATARVIVSAWLGKNN